MAAATTMPSNDINNYRRSVRELNFLDSNFTDYAQIQVAKDDDKFEETYDLKLLYRIINKLPDDTKQPFMMFVSGLKYKEIAEKMDLPIGTIKSRLHFARKKLQKDLRDFS